MILVTGAIRFGAGEFGRLKQALERNIAMARKSDGCEAYSYSI